jgi:hypothetical protein
MQKCRILALALFMCILSVKSWAADDPGLILSKSEAEAIKASLGKYPLLDQSFDKLRLSVETALHKPMEIPSPGEAGGYEHERHKQNYRDMQGAGVLYRITGDEKYAQFVKAMLLKYAAMYPDLPKHPLAHNQAPGKLFHQMLNETVWLTYSSMAYDCIHAWLDDATRTRIEKNVFREIINWFTTKNRHEFNRIHNHGTWTVCSIGLIGYVLNDQHLVDMALYGTEKDGKGGFLKQLDLLFSPDGYYMEGPYYVRYALRPFFLFAEAIERNQPELKIYEHRDQILMKAYYSAVQTTFPSGIFPPINDASRTMDIKAPGIILGNSLVHSRYGSDINLLGLAKIQQEVLLNGAGLALARDYDARNAIPDCNWGSVEFSDGHDGKRGGLGILRNGTGDGQTMLLMKYGVHGLGHGHFDKLHFILYNQGREIIPDYGFCRWINIEPKFGGRYLPENKSYAKQTIAHNTVTVDQQSQNLFNRKEADKMWAEGHFFSGKGGNVQAMSARADTYYPGVKMQRTMLLIADAGLDYPVIVDLYRINSADEHSYDYPIHHRGQLISLNFEYESNYDLQKPIGNDFGYQHIWDKAGGSTDQCPQITWLDGNRYYSLTHSAYPNSKILFGRTGANDPNFNLISEPMFLFRVTAKDHLFASVIEPHGYFNEAREQSFNARSRIESVSVVGHNDKASVIEVKGLDGLHWRIMVNNGVASETEKHSVEFDGVKYSWIGNYNVELDIN